MDKEKVSIFQIIVMIICIICAIGFIVSLVVSLFYPKIGNYIMGFSVCIGLLSMAVAMSWD